MNDKFNSWEYVFKYDSDTYEKIETNLVYTPLTNNDKTKLCLLFDHTSYYQTEMLKSWLPNRSSYTKEQVKFFFDREVKYLNIFKDKDWAPTIQEINIEEQYIIIDWPGETLNTVIYENRDLHQYCVDWKLQMFSIIKDICDSGYYKPTLYSHCFYVENNILKTFDFYGTVERNNPYIDLKDIQSILGIASLDRFDEAIENDYLNVEIFTKRAMEKYIPWPDNELNTIYKRLFQ